jgi:serine protease Do
MSKTNSQGFRVLALLALLAAIGLGFSLARTGAIGDEPRATEVNPTTLRYAEQLSEAFHNAADIAMPSVVTIHSRAKAQTVRGNTRRGEDPFKGTPFEDFFKDRGFELMPQIPMPRREGTGSGVIIDSAGLVMTNNHVVEGADEVVVQLADGREFKADDIKTDPSTDLAVIRIRAGSLPAAKIGDSDKLRTGDWVIAIGSPFELDQTVSAGIISGQGRELRSVRSRARFLQTDAAINPGNSGGPLVNLRGEVVGINTAIATGNGTFSGVGFAIPINLAKWVTSQLIAKGSVERAYLGVHIEDMNPDLAEKLNAPREGVAVSSVQPNSPASEAGFEPFDVITRFNGQKVSGAHELQALVERAPLGSKQEVEVVRKGQTMTLSVTPRALPKDALAASGRNDGFERSTPANPSNYVSEEMGVEVSDLAAEQAKEMQVKGGVLVANVDPDKPGFQAGLRSGMVIMSVDRTPVKNVEDFKAAMKGKSLKDKILLHVQAQPGVYALLVVKE